MDSETLRSINRRVAERYAPELIEFFSTCVHLGFTPRLTHLKFEGDALSYYNELVAAHMQNTLQGHPPH